VVVPKRRVDQKRKGKSDKEERGRLKSRRNDPIERKRLELSLEEKPVPRGEDENWVR